MCQAQKYNYRSLLSFSSRSFLCSVFTIIFFTTGPACAQSSANSAFGSPSSAYRLVGTIEGKAFTGAVLDDTTGKQSFYRLRELLPDGSLLVSVRAKSITVKSADGTLSEVYVSAGAQSASVATPAAPAVNTTTVAAPINQPSGESMKEIQQRNRKKHERRQTDD